MIEVTPTEVVPGDHARMRLTKVDEFQFLTCVKHGLWGSHTNRFKSWQVGDVLVIFVGKDLAGLGRVVGKPFKSNEQVWDNGLFPHRVPLHYEIVLLPEHRPPLLGDVRDGLAKAFPSGGYGLGILNQLLVPAVASKPILAAMTSAPNDADYVATHIDELMDKAKALRKLPKPKAPAEEIALEAATVTVAAEEPPSSTEEESLHSQIQARLIELGMLTGCKVWIATNDQGRTYLGKPLGAECLKTLPQFGLSPDAMKRVGLIDVIWFRNNAPLYAFEVEATTSIYSGLLRMSDLLSSVPALKLTLFIVAPKVRELKVLAELGRPTFQKIGLSDYCGFIAAEELQGLIAKVSGLAGHLQPTIIETVKVELPESVTIPG